MKGPVMGMHTARRCRFIGALALSLSAVPALAIQPARAANPTWSLSQFAAGDDEDLDGGPDGGSELRRNSPERAPQPHAPSEDGTDDAPDSGSTPDEPSGCIFRKQPLELLV